jgi:aminoglycoside phosphotransferase (APT) family kinase protein
VNASVSSDAPAVQQHVDAARLEAWCTRSLPGFQGPVKLGTFPGGNSNPTFLLSCADGQRLVMRKRPPGTPLQTAHRIDREFRMMRALEGTEVPVPRMLSLCEDESIIGTSFFVMEHVEGRIFRDPALPGVTPAERQAVFDELNRVLCALHRVDHRAIGLEDYGRPGNYYERQFSRWERQYRAAEYECIPAMEELLARIPGRIPRDTAVAIVHGDYRLENTIFHPTEPRILAVLDWELSTIGNPLADLAYNCLAYRTSSRAFGTVAGLDLPALGIPDEQAYVETYCRRMGRGSIADFPFHVGFALFRLAAIAQGREKRRREGAAHRILPPGNGTVDFARQALKVLGWG